MATTHDAELQGECVLHRIASCKVVSEMPILHGGGGVDLGNRSRLTAIPTMSRRHISLDVGFATGIPLSSPVWNSLGM
jgi:hypothetical protein